MKQVILEIIQNEALTAEVYRMALRGDTSAITNAGQFVQIALPGKFLRRPISVCDVCGDELTIIYKTVGQGTEQMAGMAPGVKLNVLTGLGNGYDTSVAGDLPVLVGGGAGIPPLYGLCRKLLREGRRPSAVLGFNKKSEIFLAKEFEQLGVPTCIATADGSVGRKGFVTDVLKTLCYSYFYACGPMPMFKAMEQVVTAPGQYSMEERMACGFGACMGCSIQTRSGAKRVCKDGPVFLREEVFGWTQA